MLPILKKIKRRIHFKKTQLPLRAIRKFSPLLTLKKKAKFVEKKAQWAALATATATNTVQEEEEAAATLTHKSPQNVDS